jgi:hypothetical protein
VPNYSSLELVLARFRRCNVFVAEALYFSVKHSWPSIFGIVWRCTWNPVSMHAGSSVGNLFDFGIVPILIRTEFPSWDNVYVL